MKLSTVNDYFLLSNKQRKQNTCNKDKHSHMHKTDWKMSLLLNSWHTARLVSPTKTVMLDSENKNTANTKITNWRKFTLLYT